MNTKISIDDVIRLLESGYLTPKDYNIFLENTTKSTTERLVRRTRATKPDAQLVSDPIKKANHALHKDADSSPMKTGRGKAAVRRQARKNKLHPEKFKTDKAS